MLRFDTLAVFPTLAQAGFTAPLARHSVWFRLLRTANLKDMPSMYALVFALALALVGCSKDTPTSPAPKVNPGSDEITSPPGLFPDPGEHPVQGLNTVGGPDELDAAADVLWGSILGTEKKDLTLARALDGISVLISGVTEVDGREQLYLGIDRKMFAQYDIENLRSVLETRFPDIPIYIEPSDGVDLLNTLEDEEEEPEETDVFSDTFNDGLDSWSAHGSWKNNTFDTYPVPDEADDNKVALVHSDDCSGNCMITTTPINLSGYTSVTLSFHRWLDDTLGDSDRFTVEVGNDGTYTTLGTWGKDEGDDVWHYHTIAIDEEHLGTATTFRFTAHVNNLSDLFSAFFGSSTTAQDRVMALDNVTVSGVLNPDYIVNIAVQDVSVTPTEADAGTLVSMSYAVKNIGIVTVQGGDVRVYRHLAKTDTPETGGVKVATQNFGSVEPEGMHTETVNVETPNVPSDTAVYYYVCADVMEGEEQVGDNCSGAVAVVVRAIVTETPEPEEPTEDPTETPTEEPNDTTTEETPAVTCEDPSPWVGDWKLIHSREVVMGGDFATFQPDGDTNTMYAGTISLGGIETATGVRGFVSAAHNVIPYLEFRLVRSRFDQTVVGETKQSPVHGRSIIWNLLGKTHTTPELTKTGKKYFIGGDVALIAYPWRSLDDCMQVWEGNAGIFCVEGNSGDDQIEAVLPLTIRGKCDDRYTVIGSETPKKGLNLWLSGGVSGLHDEMVVKSDKKMLIVIGGEIGKEIYQFMHEVYSETEIIGGDSGAPIYTVPDEDGNTHIVGVVSASKGKIIYFTSWEDTENTLDLKAIEQELLSYSE